MVPPPRVAPPLSIARLPSAVGLLTWLALFSCLPGLASAATVASQGMGSGAEGSAGSAFLTTSWTGGFGYHSGVHAVDLGLLATFANEAPLTGADSLQVQRITEVVIPVGQLLDNDIDADGEPLQVVEVLDAENCSVSLVPGGVRCLPRPIGPTAEVAFSYRLRDGDGADALGRVHIRFRTSRAVSISHRSHPPRTDDLSVEAHFPDGRVVELDLAPAAEATVHGDTATAVTLVLITGDNG